MYVSYITICIESYNIYVERAESAIMLWMILTIDSNKLSEAYRNMP